MNHKRLPAKIALILVALMVGCAIGSLGAQEGIDSLFPAVPSNYVNDAAAVLSPDWESVINGQIQHLRDSTTVEIAVVTLHTLNGYEPYEVATRIGRKWEVGGQGGPGDFARNSGIVLLVVPKTARNNNKGECFIAPGRGVEGWITDARAARLCRNAIERGFRSNDYERGIGYILTDIYEQSYDAYAEAVKTPEQRAREAELTAERRSRAIINLITVLTVLAVLGGLIFVVMSLVLEWKKKNRRIADLEELLDSRSRSYKSEVNGLKTEIQKLSRFLYPAMTIAAFTRYWNKEDKKEKERIRKLKEAEAARLEKERLEREYWASPEGQAELKRREEEERKRRKRQQEEEEERRRRRQRQSSYGYGSGRSSGGSGGGFGGFGGGGGFSGGGGGSSW